MSSVLAFGMPGPWEWAVIGLVALLFFGKRLPDVARSVGRSIVEFKKGMREVQNDLEHEMHVEPKSPSRLEGKSEGPGKSTNTASDAKP